LNVVSFPDTTRVPCEPIQNKPLVPIQNKPNKKNNGIKKKNNWAIGKRKKKREDYGFIIVISCVYVSCVTIGIARATSSPISVSFVIVM